MVRVMRYQYLQGERRLTPAGNGQTDDKGQYRVWGLMPGDYYVNALARGRRPGRQFGRRRGGPGGGRWSRRTRRRDRRRSRRQRPARGDDDQEQVNYAPTYYPGVPSVERGQAGHASASARKSLDINFNMQLVRDVAHQRHVTNPDGTPVDERQRQPDAGYGRRAASRSA